MFWQCIAGQQAQMREHLLGVGVAFEQCEQMGVAPQWRGAQVRLEDRLILGVHEGDRHGADFE